MLNKGATVAEVARTFAHRRDHLVPLETDLRRHAGRGPEEVEGALRRRPAPETLVIDLALANDRL